MTTWPNTLDSFDDRLESYDDSCPGFHQCVDRNYETGKEDCEECKQDTLNAMNAFPEVGVDIVGKDRVRK